MASRRYKFLVLLVAAGLTLTACGQATKKPLPETPSSPPTTAPTTPTTSPAGPATEPGAPNSKELTQSPAAQDASADARLLATGLRVGSHPGFDRVVVEFAGTGKPGWFTDWVTESFDQGKGDKLNVPGKQVLDVLIRGTRIPESDAEIKTFYQGPKTLQAGKSTVVWDGTFEGETHLAIGLPAQATYRISTLSSPTRLVIDIAVP